MANKKVLRLIVLVLWLFIIFWFSDQPGEVSSKQSTEVIETVVDVVSNKTEEEKKVLVKDYTFLVRKTAHFSEYLFLAILVFRFLILFDIKYLLFICMIFCILFASLDEYHQSYVSDRSSRIVDVFIDSGGAFAGLIISNFVNKYKSKK